MAGTVCAQGAPLIPEPVRPLEDRPADLQVCFSPLSEGATNLGLFCAPSLSSSRPPFAPTNFLFLLTCRLPLPEPWRGLRDEALDQVSGIPGCIFVHTSGFIGGHHTREGALSMARATLAQRPVPMSPTNPLP